MKTQRITVRLPEQVVRTIDLFIKIGEFGSRSEAIRRAVGKLLDERTDEVLQKVEKMKKVQELEALSEELEIEK